MYRFASLSLCVLFLLGCRAVADEISLKNGDRLTGSIVKADPGAIVLHTDYAGDISLKWDAVREIHSTQQLHVELKDGKTATGAVAVSGDSLQVTSRSGAVVETASSNVKTLRNDAEQSTYDKTLHAGLLQDWKGGLNVGFSLTGGNSQTENLALAFTAIRQTLHDKLGLYANSVYAANNGPGAVPATTANTVGGGLRYDHDLKPRVFVFAAADFFADALQGLNLRAAPGGGGGFHAIKKDTTTLDFLGGLNYTHESYDTLTRSLAAVTIGEELMHKLGKSTVLNLRLYFFPDLNSTGDFRGTFDFATVTKMNRWLGWQNSFSDVYVTNPPAGKKQNDLIFTTGLNVSFAR